MNKEYDFAKLKELKNPYLPKQKAVRITPEPEVLRPIGEESARNGTASLSSRQIDSIIRSARQDKKRAKKPPQKAALRTKA